MLTPVQSVEADNILNLAMPIEGYFSIGFLYTIKVCTVVMQQLLCFVDISNS